MRTREIKKEMKRIENCIGSISYVINILINLTQEMRKQSENFLQQVENAKKPASVKNAHTEKKAKKPTVAKNTKVTKTTTKKNSVVAKNSKKQKTAKKTTKKGK